MNDLRKDFPEELSSPGIIERDKKIVAYYSQPLGIWVKGSPKKDDDRLYCRITEEKLTF